MIRHNKSLVELNSGLRSRDLHFDESENVWWGDFGLVQAVGVGGLECSGRRPGWTRDCK
jgi:hypothetical protein